MIFNLQFVKASDLTESHRIGISDLNAECFGDVPDIEITENFIAVPFGYILAFSKDKIIASAALYKHDIIFAGDRIHLGGIGGVCVSRDFRHHGIASSMLKRAILVLTHEHCDIACLNVDLGKKVYPMYEKLGFTLMSREVSFENVRGEIVKELGSMFAPLNSTDKYNLVMNSPVTFHYGRGYW